MSGPRDDLGCVCALDRPPRRVVSLVPSLTEAVAVSAPGLLVGATDWCSHPAGLDVVRVRGTKNPDRKAVLALRPDLVLANKEENRELDVTALRAAGIEVWVTDIRTVAQAFTSLRRMFTAALQRHLPDWLVDAEREWSAPPPEPELRTAVAVWRDPWMAVGPDTFTSDLLGRLGLRTVVPPGGKRYPTVTVEALLGCAPELVVLPDEPYAFSASDGPEMFPGLPVALVPGRLLTWYGPSLRGARATLLQALRNAA